MLLVQVRLRRLETFVSEELKFRFSSGVGCSRSCKEYTLEYSEKSLSKCTKLN